MTPNTHPAPADTFVKRAAADVVRKVRAGTVGAYDDEIAELEERLALLRQRRARAARKLSP